MSSKQCPRCGLWNTETALRCDCGHDFITGKFIAAKVKKDSKPTIIQDESPGAQFLLTWIIASVSFVQTEQ
jgi:hypothetical protein